MSDFSPQDLTEWAQAIAITAYLLLDVFIKVRKALRDDSIGIELRPDSNPVGSSASVGGEADGISTNSITIAPAPDRQGSSKKS